MKAKAKLGRILTTEAQMRAEMRATRRRELIATKILAARYDRRRDEVVVELSTGATLAVPRRAIAGFAKAPPRVLSDLSILPGRETLWSETWDSGVLLEQLFAFAAGEELIASLGASINAKKKSPARAAASRANGKKGGRPRKSAA